MKKLMNKLQNVWAMLMVATLGVLVPIAAHAEPAGLTLPSSVDLSDLFPFAAAIVAALVGMIVIRKAVKLTNRT